MSLQEIRNFSIIAHIDHGKSTLADRFLECTRTIDERQSREQFLDTMELERERGITIKSSAVRMVYKINGNQYVLNLIDTPGHVDFHYEVSRSLAACEGALLVVDAAQGVQAQTLANAYLAVNAGLEIIPVVNKIDLPGADVEKVKHQIQEVVGLSSEGMILASAKEGTGIESILEAVIHRVPPPEGDPDGPLKALVFDSWYDTYQGVVVLVRVFEGTIRVGDNIRFMASGREFEVQRLGVQAPRLLPLEYLRAGEVGFVMAGMKDIRESKVGDTITGAKRPASVPMPGFHEIKPMVFAGMYPIEQAGYHDLRGALEKLRLNDASLFFEPETSAALGFGFRCGFLGLLHMEIVQERLEREFTLKLLNTAPTVVYQVILEQGEDIEVENPSALPPANEINSILEPWVLVTIHLPDEYLGSVLKLCQDRRGVQKELRYYAYHQVLLAYELPLSEIMFDFYDFLKSVSRGYASMDYELLEYRSSPLVRLDILINGEMVDALSSIAHKERAYRFGKELVERLRKLIPRQLFEVVIQAAIGNRVISRERVSPLRKDVTAKLYGGDVTRKRKLLEKQKAGKQRMKQVGKVQIPQEAFLSILKRE